MCYAVNMIRLICPVCKNELIKDAKRAVCANGHSYDVAKSGYLNLYLSRKVLHGDGADMVRARTSFLNSGAYGFLRTALADIFAKEGSRSLADLGCGEGWYTRFMPQKEKAAFDLAKTAMNYAAKQDPSSLYCVASIFHLPLADACTDSVLTCFAPVASDEIVRILKPGGIFVLVSPGPDHLFEFKQLLYEEPYRNPMKDVHIDLDLERDFMIRDVFSCDAPLLNDLFAMTPYAWHSPKESLQRIRSIDHLSVTAEFRIRLYRKK